MIELEILQHSQNKFYSHPTNPYFCTRIEKHRMKRVNEYKKLFNATTSTTLKELKTTYRGLVKEWHPDKFRPEDPMFLEAEIKSQQVIDAYHFLASIVDETKNATLDEYNKETLESTTAYDFKHKGLVLEVEFSDGNTYEYFGVNRALFQKLDQLGQANAFRKKKHLQ